MTMVSLVSKSQKETSKAKGGKLSMSPGEDPQSPPRLYLEHYHLEKLGIKKMPPVGTKIPIHAVAHVGSTSEDQDRGNGDKPRRSMTLHIHQMDMGTDDQPGMTDEAQDAESKKGARAEMEKALAGSGPKPKAAGGKKGAKGG